MNISIRNVNNCEKLDESRVEDLMKKLNIKFSCKDVGVITIILLTNSFINIH